MPPYLLILHTFPQVCSNQFIMMITIVFFEFYNSIMGLMAFKFASSEAPYHEGN